MATTTANASHLSDPRYGYDAVIGVTQTALNDNIRAYVLNRTHKTRKLYWVANANGKLTLTPYQTVQSFEGLDPLSFTRDQNGPSEAARRGLWNKGFRIAVASTLGANEKTNSATVPAHMVKFSPNSQFIVLQVIWRDFVLVMLTADLQWRVYTQNPALPWTLSPSLNMATIVHRIDNKLDPPPKIVGMATRNASGQPGSTSSSQSGDDAIFQTGKQTSSAETPTFQIPSLLLNFGHPTTWNIGTDDTHPQSLSDQLLAIAPAILTAAFEDSPLPVKSIVDRTTPWSFLLSNYTFMINSYVDGAGKPIPSLTTDQSQATTLNYLCGIKADKKVPPANAFGWNWIEAGQVNPYHGVFALNRSVLRDLIETGIKSQVQQSCVSTTPACIVTVQFGNQPNFNQVFFGATFAAAKTAPSVTRRDDSTQVLYFQWDQTANSGQQFGNSSFGVAQAYTCSVDFQDNQIIIRQNLQFNINVQINGAPLLNGKVVSTQYVDTYTITVDQFGGLSWSVAHETLDDLPANNDNTALQQISMHGFDFKGQLEKALQVFKPMKWGSYEPGSPAPSFILPAGSTFSCANARFSDHQDLIVNLIYAS